METLAEAKKHLRENWEIGCACPACGQRVQVYKYKLFSTSAAALIRLYNLCSGNDSYYHIKQYAEAGLENGRAPHFAELRFWGLVEAKPNQDGKLKASGYWRITDKGRDFVRNSITLPPRIQIYNNKFVGFNYDDPMINITDALTNKFSYEELLNG